MRAGELRHRITLQKLVQTENEYGELVESWADHATVWAQVEDLRGKEFHVARQVPGGEVTTRVKMRYRTDVDRTMRIVHDGRVLVIEAVLDPDGKRQLLELMCRELV